jgi:hypothetical protein
MRWIQVKAAGRDVVRVWPIVSGAYSKNSRFGKLWLARSLRSLYSTIKYSARAKGQNDLPVGQITQKSVQPLLQKYFA